MAGAGKRVALLTKQEAKRTDEKGSIGPTYQLSQCLSRIKTTRRLSAGFLNKMQKLADYVETNNQQSHRQQHALLSRLKEHEERMKAGEDVAGGTSTNPDRGKGRGGGGG